MTTSYTYSERRELGERIAHFVVLILGLVGAGYFFLQIINAWDVASAQKDQNDIAGWFVLLGVAALFCGWIVGTIYAEKVYSNFRGWSAGLVAAAVFTAGVWLWETSIPNHLRTEDGYLRIMDSGEVLSSGTTAIGPRDRAISHVVPQMMRAPVRLYVETENGASLEVFMQVEVTLNNHPMLAGVFVRGDSRREELNRALDLYFEPFLRLLVRDVEEGRVSALDTAMLIRLGELMRARPDRVPEWTQEIQVADFRVARARQTG